MTRFLTIAEHKAQSAKTFEKGFLGFCLKPSAQAKGFVKIKIRVRNKKK
jgi:hypothetical protein